MAFRAPEISPFTEVAAAATTATATLRLAGNELTFRTNSFVGVFWLFISIFVSVGSSKWFSFV